MWEWGLYLELTVWTHVSESGTVALESNRVLLAGGVDGKIRVLDASLRTNQVERVLEACNVSEPSDAYLRVLLVPHMLPGDSRSRPLFHRRG